MKTILSFLEYSEQIKDFNQNKENFKSLQNEISYWNQKAMKIQSKFDFVLPNYIIDEIVECEEKNDFYNLHYLINCAVVNGKISADNGKKIKQIYCL